MPETKQISREQYLSERRFFLLLILFFVMLVVGPFIRDYGKLRYFFDLVVSAIFLSAMYAIVERTRHLIIAVCLAVPMLLSVWLKYFLDFKAFSITGEICGILFFAYSIYNIVKYLFKQKEVTKETIYAAVVIYMLLAFMWARAYRLLDMIHPGSFSMPEGNVFSDTTVYLYYSFVTITTLGYGDISPLTDKASGLTIMEAISGQIFLVVLVSWLVGMHVSKRSR